MLTTKDTLPTQLYYLYYAISKNLSAEKKVDILLQALSCTLPNFDIHFIYNYRLSWAELSLLTNIAFEYQTIDANKSNVYFSKILDYFLINSFDICFMNSFLSPTLTMYCTNLYIQKHYYELLDLLSEKILVYRRNLYAILDISFFIMHKHLVKSKNITLQNYMDTMHVLYKSFSNQNQILMS